MSICCVRGKERMEKYYMGLPLLCTNDPDFDMIVYNS